MLPVKMGTFPYLVNGSLNNDKNLIIANHCDEVNIKGSGMSKKSQSQNTKAKKSFIHLLALLPLKHPFAFQFTNVIK